MAEDIPNTVSIAREAARDLLAGIDIQEQLVTKEHDFKTKLFVWDNFIEHLNSLVAEDSEAHKLLLAIIDKLIEIRELIESYEIQELRLIKEEKSVMQQIENDVERRNWKLVKVEKKFEKKKAKKYEKLEITELEKLKRKFFELKLLMEKSKAVKINPVDARASPEEFKNAEEYYFLQIYRFCLAYFSIMNDLMQKEELILRRTK